MYDDQYCLSEDRQYRIKHAIIDDIWEIISLLVESVLLESEASEEQHFDSNVRRFGGRRRIRTDQWFFRKEIGRIAIPLQNLTYKSMNLYLYHH